MMNEKLAECLTNPIKNKLIMAIKDKGRTTAKELAQIVDKLPQATLYRYLRKMVADGLIEVVEENQIRNVKEKVYGMAIDYDAEVKAMAVDTSGKTYVAQFQRFSNGLVEQFQKYTPENNDRSDRISDGSCFFITPFYASYDEVRELLRKIDELVEPFEKANTEGRQLRNLATIITPPTAEKEGVKE
jgi:DNA-binding Lrp family transcriptional regulator